MALTRPDLAVKYVKDTLIKHISEPEMLANLMKKITKTTIGV